MELPNTFETFSESTQRHTREEKHSTIPQHNVRVQALSSGTPDVSEAVQGHVECAGDGRGGERQNVHRRLQRADALLLTHAEPLRGTEGPGGW